MPFYNFLEISSVNQFFQNFRYMNVRTFIVCLKFWTKLFSRWNFNEILKKHAKIIGVSDFDLSINIKFVKVPYYEYIIWVMSNLIQFRTFVWNVFSKSCMKKKMYQKFDLFKFIFYKLLNAFFNLRFIV